MIFYKPDRPVDRVFIHCTASDKDTTVEEIRAWHTARNFDDIGYHFLIRRDGTVDAGRALDTTPAAQKGNNAGTIAICLNGLSIFTIEQIQSLVGLCMAIDTAYDHEITFHGHNEVANKACPVFNHREVLRLDAAGQMLRGV